MTRIWCNGQWIDPLDFNIASTDRGLMHGLGLFETLLAVDGRPVFAGHHLERFARGCERLGWRMETADLAAVMIELLHHNQLGTGRGRIRLAATAGSGVIGDLTRGGDGLLWMTASPAAEPPAATSVNVSPFTRNEHSPLAGLKCASYAENHLALDHARRLGFEETLFFNNAGHLCEAATSNVFLVKDATLRTPALDCGCLPGVIRAVVIGLAAHRGIPCDETRLTTADVHSADAIFLTSSIRGVMGVSRLDERNLPPCDITATLRRAWEQAIRSEAETSTTTRAVVRADH
jgi:branched-subunit amino acid aminotransferase/4-amino-4-deoxychorismate lyase